MRPRRQTLATSSEGRGRGLSATSLEARAHGQEAVPSPRRGRGDRVLAPHLPQDGGRGGGRHRPGGGRREGRGRAGPRSGRRHLQPEGERRGPKRHRRAAGHAARGPPQPPRPDRRQAGLRPGRLRRLHGAPRRAAREFVPAPRGRCRGSRDHDRRRPRDPGEAEPAAGRLRREGRPPVWLLHSGLRSSGNGAPREDKGPDARADQGRVSPATCAGAEPTAGSSRPWGPPPRRRGVSQWHQKRPRSRSSPSRPRRVSPPTRSPWRCTPAWAI